ncbi:hypothetical protein [Saccharopolyspora mangrovi]|uniref:MarR family transcriptional regulator n=1 Tax=Saccharopolyspora mangrovi TaxID=3082379 RepID=A0ABU6AC86_9PSEU|nr:hypothetical protein [Saccharopolyspora sp. S2-29]MEB3369077.1 hypothetical protein [Saccharopolyspora sp. S2-29]
MTAVAVLNHRQLAMLRAVAGGRAEITCSCEPDLYVDGLPCCDQSSARDLVQTGLLRAAGTGPTGQRVTAALTDLGRAALR